MSAVERGQPFAEVGNRAERHRLALVQLNDLIRNVTTGSDLAYSASELLGLTLDIGRVGYGTIDHDAEALIVEREWNVPGVQSLAGVLPLRQFGSYIDNVKRGELVVVPDVYLDERTVAAAAQLEGLSARAFVAVCVTERERMSAVLYVSDANVREWPADDLAFIEEVANRTRTAIERLRAEAGLLESDLRLQELKDDVERQIAEKAQIRSRTWMISPDLMGVANPNGFFEQSNPAWQSVLGWSEPEVAATPFFEFIHPDDLLRTRGVWMDALERGVPALRFENRYRCKNGSWRWLSWVAVPENGKVYCSARDITQERAQAAELADRTAERDRMWETSPDLMLVIDFQGVFQRVNPAWTTMLGYVSNELVGHHVNEFVLPDDHDETIGAYEYASRGGQPSIVNRYRHKDGTVRWISWVAAPAGDATYATGRDVTAEKEGIAQLAARTAERNRLWDLSQDMFARANLEGMMSAVSPAWTQVLGWSEEELLSRPYASFMHEEDMGPTLDALAAMGETGRPTRFENRIASIDGGWKWIEWTVAPELGGQNFIAVGRDLSEVKTREAELAAAQDALRQSQKMEAVGQLTGGLAHDFNNIIAGIGGSLELISKRLSQGRLSEVDRYVVAAQGATRRAANLTNRLLAFSRRQTLVPKLSKMDALVADMVDLISRSVGPQIRIETTSSAGIWSTYADVGQIENALLNLCINARDAMPDGGTITISTDNIDVSSAEARDLALKPGQYVRLRVRDEGAGMSKAVLERATEPFFTTKPTGQGTGLGLSMVYGFAAQSGGAVHINSEVDKGTTVSIYLPRHVGDMPGTEEEESKNETSLDSTNASKTILLVDDEVLVRMVVADQLAELGYTIIEAGDAKEAMRLASEAEKIDLLLTDVGLPSGMNGRQLADAILQVRPGLPVIFITGYAEQAVLNNGDLEAGMRVMTKPFAADKLAQMVVEILGSE